MEETDDVHLLRNTNPVVSLNANEESEDLRDLFVTKVVHTGYVRSMDDSNRCRGSNSSLGTRPPQSTPTIKVESGPGTLEGVEFEKD